MYAHEARRNHVDGTLRMERVFLYIPTREHVKSKRRSGYTMGCMGLRIWRKGYTVVLHGRVRLIDFNLF